MNSRYTGTDDSVSHSTKPKPSPDVGNTLAMIHTNESSVVIINDFSYKYINNNSVKILSKSVIFRKSLLESRMRVMFVSTATSLNKREHTEYI